MSRSNSVERSILDYQVGGVHGLFDGNVQRTRAPCVLDPEPALKLGGPGQLPEGRALVLYLGPMGAGFRRRTRGSMADTNPGISLVLVLSPRPSGPEGLPVEVIPGQV